MTESVCPGPSGEICVSSNVIPSATSALNCSGSNSIPATLIFIADKSGTLKSPGMSSVILIRLIVADPVFSRTTVAVMSCASKEASFLVEYVLSTFASSTGISVLSTVIVPFVVALALGRTV